VKRLVLECFYKWIYIFGKKTSERILTRKLWNHAIDTKKKFVPRKRKVYLLSREEREDVCKFILKQLRKEYISVKFTNGGLNVSLFYFSFLFLFHFIFLFSIFRITRIRADRSRCHISHNLMA